jgi:hypothetical protein
VLTIILRGDFSALADIRLNQGDLMFAGSLLSFSLYSALMTRRPATHQLSSASPPAAVRFYYCRSRSANISTALRSR